MKKVLFWIVIFVIGIHTATADEVTFVGQAPDAVVSGQQFRLSYTVNSHSVKDFRTGDITDFSILSGPNRSSSTSMNIINGKVSNSSTITYTYILMGEKEGTFTIPAATIVVEGKQMSSNTVTIKVLPPDKSAGASSSGNNNQGGVSQSNSTGTEISNNDLFIRTEVNKTNVYEQEAILLTYKIYATVNLTELQGKMPDLKGFHTQSIELPRNKTWELEHYNGRNYRTITWSQYVLFPQQSGELEIPSVSFDGIVSQQVRGNIDPFEAFFNGGAGYVKVKKRLTTPKVTINVNPLPAGKPADFSGGVGEFSVSSSISTTELKTNDAVTLKFIISGTGNMKLIKTPEVEFPKDFEIYDPKIENKFSLKTNGLSGNKVIEYLAIPRYAGTFTIPPVKFSYFDLKTKKYKTLETQPYTLNVEKGEGSSGEAVASFINKEELRLLGEDIRYINLDNVKLTAKGDYFFGTTIYYLWYIIPTAIFVLFIVIYRKKAIENANVARMRTKKANKVALKRLKNAHKLLIENKKGQFYDEVLRALWGYVSDKLSIPLSQLSKDNIETELKKKNIDEQLIKNFEDALNTCEFAHYAPGEGNETMDKTYQEAIDVISKMESNIKI